MVPVQVTSEREERKIDDISLPDARFLLSCPFFFFFLDGFNSSMLFQRMQAFLIAQPDVQLTRVFPAE